jgi:hypothetical protein
MQNELLPRRRKQTMTENHRPLKEIDNWIKSDLEAFLEYISSQEKQEHEYLEFKGAKDFESNSLTDSFKILIGKEIVAFANTKGGVSLLGVEEDKDNKIFEVKSGVAKDKYPLNRIIDILIDRTNPRYLEIKVHPIKWSETHNIYAVEIPEFVSVPLQNKDFKYYGRSNESSQPLEEHIVRSLYFKGKSPNVEISFRSKLNDSIISGSLLPDPYEQKYHIIVTATNISHIRAHDLRIDFRFNNCTMLTSNLNKVQLENATFTFPYPDTQFDGPLFGDFKKEIDIRKREGQSCTFGTHSNI